MIDAGYKQAYEQLLKDNTRLHAEKKHIAEQGAKGIERATYVVDTLHKVLDNLILETKILVENAYPDSSVRKGVLAKIEALTPIKIGADGKERLKT